MTDPNSGGPKTYGSGTLFKKVSCTSRIAYDWIFVSELIPAARCPLFCLLRRFDLLVSFTVVSHYLMTSHVVYSVEWPFND
jgi:hypothetical protein